MVSWRVVATALAVLLPYGLPAQDQPRTITQLLAGVGLTGSEQGWRTPTYMAGVEIGRARSSTSFRIVTEYSAEEQFPASLWHRSRTVGAQLLGVRTFGARRIQPYLLAGAGLYQTTSEGVGLQFVPDESGAMIGRPFLYKRNETRPTLIWGTGASVRISAVKLFLETKLPLYYSNAFHWGPQSPLLVGLRF